MTSSDKGGVMTYAAWVLMIWFSTASVLAEGSATTQPRFKSDAANEAVAAEITAEAKAKADYDKAVAAIKTELIAKLEAVKDKATKAGDLDEAVKLRDKIAALKAEATTKPATTFITAAELTGTWKLSRGGSFTFNKDGSLTVTGTPVGNYQHTWK